MNNCQMSVDGVDIIYAKSKSVQFGTFFKTAISTLRQALTAYVTLSIECIHMFNLEQYVSSSFVSFKEFYQ